MLRNALDSIFNFIQEYCQNPSAKYPDLNTEQLEVFINNYCSPCQVLLHTLGSANLEDAYLNSIMQLVKYMYQQHKKILSGGIFIENGIIIAVDERIKPLSREMLSHCQHAMTLDMNLTDAHGMRLACGNLSDICGSDGDAIKPMANVFIA